eukprot:scaffold246_cov414-Prasinococcus_capsulatus_cf.AAC.15
MASASTAVRCGGTTHSCAACRCRSSTTSILTTRSPTRSTWTGRRSLTGPRRRRGSACGRNAQTSRARRSPPSDAPRPWPPVAVVAPFLDEDVVGCSPAGRLSPSCLCNIPAHACHLAHEQAAWTAHRHATWHGASACDRTDAVTLLRPPPPCRYRNSHGPCDCTGARTHDGMTHRPRRR